MNRDTIIKLAREAGWDEMGADLWGAAFDGAMSIHALERFSALVAAAEREACAKTVEAMVHGNVRTCAASIRARWQQ